MGTTFAAFAMRGATRRKGRQSLPVKNAKYLQRFVNRLDILLGDDADYVELQLNALQ